MDVSITTFGNNKGAYRVWLQGQMLNRAGFAPKTPYKVEKAEGYIVISKEGTAFRRQVSAKRKNDVDIPIIDLNNNDQLSMFEGMEHVRVIYMQDEIRIMPLESELRLRERLKRAEEKLKNNLPLTFGSVAHGGGVLDDAIAEGFSEEGIDTRLAFANEIRADLTEHAIEIGRKWDKDTIALQGKMQEFAFDDYVMKLVGTVDNLSAGMPCSGASVAGRAKLKTSHAEAHPEVGHLSASFLAFVAKLNPLSITLESVVPYASSASMSIIRSQLKDMGYELHETVIEGGEWGAFEARRRMVMVAVTRGMHFSMADLIAPEAPTRPLSDILEDIPLDDPRWKAMEGLKAKQDRDMGNNKGFQMQIFSGDSTKIGTLTKGMTKNRSTDPKIQHPENPELLRIPTPIEHARAKQVPEGMIAGLSATIAHELLGQSVIYKPFVAIGQLLANSFKSLGKTIEPAPFELTFC